ncbi:MAG: AAA family ATPase [Desulfovibrio sp.]|nr:AAA family ATPase [Desulfovibrio sp.]
MFVRSLELTNFLSFGHDGKSFELQDLNVIIGSNGSGKSNLIDAFDLLSSAPDDLRKPIRDGGGIHDWLWRGAARPALAQIKAVFAFPSGRQDLRYVLGFTEVRQQFLLTDERIERVASNEDHDRPYFFYKFENGHAVLNLRNGQTRRLQYEEIDPVQSILSQRKDPDQYPELTWLGNSLSKIRVYREWSFGRYTIPRLAQKTDVPNDFLAQDCSNLGLILNSFETDADAKNRILDALHALYDCDDYFVQVQGGTVQIFLREGKHAIPATRLSDGTLRYLCLLAILCHPNPPPLVCIEEPELGLHPDVLPALSDLMRDAATRCQLVVTTHSDALVDALTDQPDAILIVEKHNHATKLQRLDAQALKPWLEKYRLGQLWTRGDLGGTRW